MMACCRAGPGPANDLDGQNVVFGRVLSGFEIVNSVARVQTFQAWALLPKVLMQYQLTC